MNLSRFTTISFDCYGTLIDWESGILPALRAMLADHGKSLARRRHSGALWGIRSASGKRPLPKLSGCAAIRGEGVCRSFPFPSQFHRNPLPAQSVPAWPPFPDTVPALRELKKRYRLVVISNIDDALFAETRQHLDVEFDGVITAEQARSYKPSINNFHMALRTLALAPDRLLHAGAEHLSRCGASAVAGDRDGMGEPEIGPSRESARFEPPPDTRTWRFPTWRASPRPLCSAGKI